MFACNLEMNVLMPIAGMRSEVRLEIARSVAEIATRRWGRRVDWSLPANHLSLTVTASKHKKTRNFSHHPVFVRAANRLKLDDVSNKPHYVGSSSSPSKEVLLFGLCRSRHPWEQNQSSRALGRKMKDPGMQRWLRATLDAFQKKFITLSTAHCGYGSLFGT
jgi:hypothetical protein